MVDLPEPVNVRDAIRNTGVDIEIPAARRNGSGPLILTPVYIALRKSGSSRNYRSLGSFLAVFQSRALRKH